MNLARIRRLLQLISLLQAGRGYNIEALAVECEVSRRTIFRDLELLRESSLPVVFDETARQYRIPGACLLPPTNFTPEEALSLIVLCHELGNVTGLPFLGPARSAVVKLESSLPTRLREQLRDVTAAIRIQPSPLNPLEGRKPVFDQLLEAIHQRHSVHFKKLVAPNVAEVVWHKTQRMTFRDDGSLDFRATVSGINEISWWILGYGDQAEVIEPPELRRLVADRVKQMAKMYQS